MLRQLTSLKLRAAAIFVAVFVLVVMVGFVLVAWRSLSMGGERHHAGPTVALALAAGELRLGDGAITIAEGGALEGLIAKNPSFWLIVDSKGQRHTFGSVPAHAAAFVDRYGSTLEIARFHATGLARPLSDASLMRHGDFVLAAGGVDPETISLRETLHYTLREGLLIVLLGLGVVGLIAMLVALPLLTAALRPVIADALAVRPEAPGVRIREERVPRELLPLVRSFNAALDRLSNELGRRRRFITDVAHELRTPLAIMSLQVESLEPSERKAELDRVVGRMSHLVSQMLDLERLSLSDTRRTRIDLAGLVRDILAEMAPVALASGYELSLDAPDQPVPVLGEPHALSRAVTNLIANAIAHAGGTGEIRVVVSAARTIDVIDAGPGIAPSIRQSLFEPFSRARWDGDGCGMGLHLTREIMRAHGGDAVLLETTQGATFRLCFPGIQGDACSMGAALRQWPHIPADREDTLQ